MLAPMTDRPDNPSPLPPIAVVVSRYNASITDALAAGAIAEYTARGGRADAVHVFDAPGSYELPVLARAAATSGAYRGVVALGCLIRGETRHDRYIADAVAHGLIQVSVQTGVPCTFGVLTVDSGKQAKARAGGAKGNKGSDAMSAVLDTIAAIDAVRERKPGRAIATPKADKAAAETQG